MIEKRENLDISYKDASFTKSYCNDCYCVAKENCCN